MQEDADGEEEHQPAAPAIPLRPPRHLPDPVCDMQGPNASVSAFARMLPWNKGWMQRHPEAHVNI